MKQVEDFRLEENVWKPGSQNGERIKKLWSKIWHRLNTYLCIEGDSNKISCMNKSQKGQIGWRTCFNDREKINYLNVIVSAEDANFRS